MHGSELTPPKPCFPRKLTTALQHGRFRCGHPLLNEHSGSHYTECKDCKGDPETQLPIGDRVEQEAHKPYAGRFALRMAELMLA